MSSDASSYQNWVRLRCDASRATYIGEEQERGLIARANAGDARALETLVESHLRLVVDIAARYKRPEIPPQDLVGEGTVGLIEAIRRFEPDHHTRLSTYAKWWIRARVRSYAMANRGLVPLPSTRAARVAIGRLGHTERALIHTLGRAPSQTELAEALGIPEQALADVLQALSSREVEIDDDSEPSVGTLSAGGGDPEQLVARREELSGFDAMLQGLLAQLSERERMIFAAQLSEGEQTLGDVGKVLGVSRQRASQIAASLRKKCRDSLSGVSAA
jgi:RNA polymerase sigma-32 factor